MIMAKINDKYLISLLVLLVIAQTGLIFVLSKQARKNYIDEKNLTTHYSYFSGLDFYEEAYKQAEGQITVADEKIYGGILPHHLMVEDKIAAFFTGIENNDYETIILIGPNHFLSGKSDIITSHTAFSYLASEYNLNQVAITGLSPDEEPSPTELAEVAQFAQEHNVQYIFFESLVSPKLSETIAEEVNAQTLVLNPIEGLSDEEISQGKTYISVMQDNLTNLQTALQCQ